MRRNQRQGLDGGLSKADLAPAERRRPTFTATSASLSSCAASMGVVAMGVCRFMAFLERRFWTVLKLGTVPEAVNGLAPPSGRLAPRHRGDVSLVAAVT